MVQQSSTVVGAVALASGTYLVGQAFVPTPQQRVTATQSSALRGAGAETALGKVTTEGGHASAAVMLGLAAGALGAVGRTAASRTARRVEPISATAAAAAMAAAKAAGAGKAASAAAGAVKAGSAVTGSATTGSLLKSSDAEAEFDEELANRKFFPQDRGTPEYERYMAQRERQKKADWDYRKLNTDGQFGSSGAQRGQASFYDPLEATGSNWQTDTTSAGKTWAGEFDPAMQVGVTDPLGYFDPAGFCKMGDETNFRNLRAAEIKHGRVAMMAALGAVVQHYVQFPGFEGVPTGLGAVNAAPGSYGAIALFAVSGALEFSIWTESDDKEPGNFGDPLGLNQYTPEMRARELNNGRMAMFAAIGIMLAEILTGKDGVEQLGF
ncbi:unnamed protein product [Polarella glacialis]|uniref:Uncharacterized protein n=1 Tax=Polarella glacialis TaxID=89957 RepID=A0A813GQD4_POLGL|nr:unnamed protein product [Polarella glacialis]CAE8627282.1 unnamed protein product [Polarella glacialis]